jgi:hypothetical protein
MFRKYLTLILAVLVINLSLSSVALAETKEEKEAKFAQKVKAKIIKLGTGKDAKIQVKLKDGMKLKGYVSEIKENSFVVTDEKTGTETEVTYPQTKQVKGNNLSTGATIAIAAGILVAIIIIVGLSSDN